MPSMSRPCFAVDIDNVLGRAEPEVQRLFQELTGTSWPVGLYGSAGGLDASQLKREVIEEIFTRFHEESIPRLPLFPGARQALAVIHRSIVLLSSRPGDLIPVLRPFNGWRTTVSPSTRCTTPKIKQKFRKRLPRRLTIIPIIFRGIVPSADKSLSWINPGIVR